MDTGWLIKGRLVYLPAESILSLTRDGDYQISNVTSIDKSEIEQKGFKIITTHEDRVYSGKSVFILRYAGIT